MLRLAKETRSFGLKGAVFLPLWPGEGMSSILARTEAVVDGAAKAASDKPGDPYARLTDYLDNKRVVLLLDDLHNLRREELLTLMRSVRMRPGNCRILATSLGEPELPAVDRAGLQFERVGPLTAQEVKKVASSLGVRGSEAQALLMTDATRGGCTGHPLTLRFLLAIFGSDLPSEDFFRGQTSRSINAFRAVIEHAADRFSDKDRSVLQHLARIGLPVSRSVATRLFGITITKLIKRGMLDIVDGEVMVHGLVAQTLGQDGEFSASLAKSVAKHLKDQGIARIEPQRMLRAAELLAHAGPTSKAIDALTEGWEAARDFGFLEAYLKSVANMPSTPALQQRLKLLSARARMRQGNVQGVREELEGLAKAKDPWTRARALTALTYVYSKLGAHKKAVAAFEAVRKGSVAEHDLIPAGTLAASSMTRTGHVADAEKLARSLLKTIKGKKQDDREGELRRLLARIYAQGGRLAEAVIEAKAAARAFEQCGDLYHAATAYGFIGDLYREAGEFELARTAFTRFHELAERWGDRNLLQVAELAEAWVSLDVGDLTHAAKRIAAVEKDMSVAPSRRLRRYLSAARALLEAGRGHHSEAAIMLERVVDDPNRSRRRCREAGALVAQGAQGQEARRSRRRAATSIGAYLRPERPSRRSRHRGESGGQGV
ncbi:MAG: tetratricopeptide repeat protein [Myxococcota bacterium]